MIATDNYIFVIGGYNSNKCEAFNLRTLKWEALPDLNSPERQYPILAVLGDYLYAFMGHTQFGVLDTVERIYIKTIGSNKWENVKVSNPNKVNMGFYGAGVFIANNKLYFIGGKVGLGDDDSDYKSEIYSFKYENNETVLYSRIILV
jgi:N-acetylneuraminic acid mutarotase